MSIPISSFNPSPFGVNALGKKAIKQFEPIQAGDVTTTYANVDNLISDLGYAPKTQIDEGINKFVDWYLSYYKP